MKSSLPSMIELEVRVLTLEGVPQDVHLETAMEIFQRSAEEITPLMRRLAKQVNYTHIYSPRRNLSSLTSLDVRCASFTKQTTKTGL